MSKMATSRGPVAALVPVGKYAGNPAIALRRTITLIGGAENAHARVQSRSVDPMHAMVLVSGGRVYVRDMASTAGVRVNGKGVREAELKGDDVLGVGSFEFRVSVPAGMRAGAGEDRVPGGTFTFDGSPVAMEGRVLLIGRRSACDVVLSDPKASRVHAAVIAVNGELIVRDLGSRSGTLVNSDKVHERAIEGGDEIHIAGHAIFYQGGAGAPAGVAGGDVVGMEDSVFMGAGAGEGVDALALDVPGVGEEVGIGGSEEVGGGEVAAPVEPEVAGVAEEAAIPVEAEGAPAERAEGLEEGVAGGGVPPEDAPVPLELEGQATPAVMEEGVVGGEDVLALDVSAGGEDEGSVEAAEVEEEAAAAARVEVGVGEESEIPLEVEDTPAADLEVAPTDAPVPLELEVGETPAATDEVVVGQADEQSAIPVEMDLGGEAGPTGEQGRSVEDVEAATPPDVGRVEEEPLELSGGEVGVAAEEAVSVGGDDVGMVGEVTVPEGGVAEIEESGQEDAETPLGATEAGEEEGGDEAVVREEPVGELLAAEEDSAVPNESAVEAGGEMDVNEGIGMVGQEGAERAAELSGDLTVPDGVMEEAGSVGETQAIEDEAGAIGLVGDDHEAVAEDQQERAAEEGVAPREEDAGGPLRLALEDEGDRVQVEEDRGEVGESAVEGVEWMNEDRAGERVEEINVAPALPVEDELRVAERDEDAGGPVRLEVDEAGGVVEVPAEDLSGELSVPEDVGVVEVAGDVEPSTEPAEEVASELAVNVAEGDELVGVKGEEDAGGPLRLALDEEERVEPVVEAQGMREASEGADVASPGPTQEDSLAGTPFGAVGREEDQGVEEAWMEEAIAEAPSEGLQVDPAAAAAAEGETEGAPLAAEEDAEPVVAVDASGVEDVLGEDVTRVESVVPGEVEATAEADPAGNGAVAEERGPAFGLGGDQAMYLAGPAMDWQEGAGLVGWTGAGVGAVELSLSGVHGTVDRVEQEEVPGEEPSEEDVASAMVAEAEADVDAGAEAEAEGQGEVAVGEAEVQEILAEAEPRMELAVESVEEADEAAGAVDEVDGGVAEVVAEPDDTQREQLLGFIRVAEEAPDEVREADREPEGLHGVVPPPAARGFVRGLSSMTGGAPATSEEAGGMVDVFSAMPVVVEDPVLGRVAAEVAREAETVEDPHLAEMPAVEAPPDQFDEALREMPGTEAARPDEGPEAAEKVSPGWVRKLRRLVRERGRAAAIVAAMVGAGAIAWALVPARSVVRGEVVYRNLGTLPADAPARQAVRVRQQALLTDPAVLAAAREEVAGQGLAPGFLADPVEVARRVERAAAAGQLWPDEGAGGVGLAGTGEEGRPVAEARAPGAAGAEGGADGRMVVSLESTDPAGDAQRLAAWLRAVAGARANREMASAGDRARARARRVTEEVAVMDRNIQELERRVAESASLAGGAGAAGRGGEVGKGEVGKEERAWRAAAVETLRAQEEVLRLKRGGAGGDDAKVREAEARVASARAAEDRAREAFEAAGGGVDPARRAAEAAVSLRTLRQQRAAKEEELARAQAEARQVVVAEVGGAGGAEDGGVWVSRAGDRRNLIAAAAALFAGLAASYVVKRK